MLILPAHRVQFDAIQPTVHCGPLRAMRLRLRLDCIVLFTRSHLALVPWFCVRAQ